MSGVSVCPALYICCNEALHARPNTLVLCPAPLVYKPPLLPAKSFSSPQYGVKLAGPRVSATRQTHILKSCTATTSSVLLGANIAYRSRSESPRDHASVCPPHLKHVSHLPRSDEDEVAIEELLDDDSRDENPVESKPNHGSSQPTIRAE